MHKVTQRWHTHTRTHTHTHTHTHLAQGGTREHVIPCRQVFPEAVTLSNLAAEHLLRSGGKAIDIDNVAQRITVDVIGAWKAMLCAHVSIL